MLRIHFQHMEPSTPLTQDITDRLHELDALARIIHCDVSVDAPQGNGDFTVRVDVRIPGKELVARGHNANAYQAAHEALELVRHQIEDFQSRRRRLTRVA